MEGKRAGLLARKKREEEGEQSLLNKTFSFRQASALSPSWQIVTHLENSKRFDMQ